ncbi:MAG: DUF4258 domain-containing protein [Lutibacter sp.]
MTFKQRLPYYLIGLFIGVILVNFIFTKKNSSFDYWPNARVLKNISKKELIFSSSVVESIKNKNIDSTSIITILKNGDVDMWNKVKLDSGFQYQISGRKSLKNTILTIKNLKEKAIVTKIEIK